MTGLYNIALLPLALLAVRCISLVNPRLRAGLTARKGLMQRIAQAARRRDTAHPLVWFHVASAGEYLQAEPLLQRYRARGCQLAITLTSPSGLQWVQRAQAWPETIWAGMAPMDRRGHVAQLLDLLQPTVLVVVQADLWPNLVLQTRKRGIPQVLIAARIAPDSEYRARWPLRGLYRGLYGGLGAIAALTEHDRKRLMVLAPNHPNLTVCGDPGIETVLARLKDAGDQPPAPDVLRTAGPRVIAGSIWPEDEAHLIPVLKEALAAFPGLTAILVPHEPDERHLQQLESGLAGFSTARFSAVQSQQAQTAGQSPRVVLVDSVGRLATLYPLATVAYVGGGFSTGVHNVAEPAAAGLPVMFGPRHAKSSVAQALLEDSGGVAVDGTDSLRQALFAFLQDEALRAERGAAAEQVVKSMVGAVKHCDEAIVNLAPRLGPVE